MARLGEFKCHAIVAPYIRVSFSVQEFKVKVKVTVDMRSVLCLLAACMPSTIAYTLVDDYMKGNFYNKFSFWNFATDGVDPAAGTGV